MAAARIPLQHGVRRLASLFLGLSVCWAAAARSETAGADELRTLRSEALAYEHGEGVVKDPLRAAKLYCDAARLGDAEARFSLGWMYANGRGVARDDALAGYFFVLAARQGYVPAEKMLRIVHAASVEIPDCMRPPEELGEDVFPAGSETEKKILGLVQKLAPEYGVSPRLALAVIRAESNFNPRAVSGKNAQGLMQLIPDTAARFKVSKPFDPEQNLRGGLSYLRWLLAYFEGNVSLVAAAYNAGEGAVNRFRGVPPYAETRGYVKRIVALFKRDEHPFDPGVTAPSPALGRIHSAQALQR